MQCKELLLSDSNYDKSFGGNKDNKSKSCNGLPFISRSLFNSSDNHNPRDNTQKKRCPFCNCSSHPPSRCLKVSNSVSQKTILYEKMDFVLIYFNGAHLASQCTSSYRCKCKYHISVYTFDQIKNSTQDNSDDLTLKIFLTNENTVLLQTVYLILFTSDRN